MTPTPAVTCHSVSRDFGATKAVRGVDLALAPGMVHALVGENGAGKSTLFGMISGRVAPSAGRIDVFGAPLPPGDPRAARRRGVAAVYQELTIVPAMSAVANAFLGQDLAVHGVRRDQEMHRQFVDAVSDLGIVIDPGARGDRLPVGQRQMVEIVRALLADARLLLLDEPTTALAEGERDALYAVIGRLRDRGVTVVIVSHNLDEVLALSDTVTVMRNGQLVESAPAQRWTKAKLVAAMLGRQLERHVPSASRSHGDVALEAAGVSVPRAIEGIDLRVRRGEILGLAGLVGSGRTTLMRSLAGLEPRSTGSLRIAGGAVRWPRDVREARSLGIVLLPEDRRSGLVAGLSAADNVTLGSWGTVSRRGVIDRSAQKREVEVAAERFGFDRRRVAAPVGALSGGNQQKVLLAKSVRPDPRLLLADEPTRGIDVGAKADVLRTLVQLASTGLAVMVASSELEEVLEVSDRVIVLAAGRSVGEVRRGDSDWSVRGLLHRAFAVESEA